MARTLRYPSTMTRWRANTTNLRLLLLGALGGAVWACAGETDDCTAGDLSCTDGSTDTGTGGGDLDGMGPTGGSGGTESGGTGGALPSSSDCTNPMPILGEGTDVGIFRCAEGYLHRQEAKTCPSVWPRPGTVEWPDAGLGGEGGALGYTTSGSDCSTDAECPEHATCTVIQTNFVEPICGPPSGYEPPVVVPNYSRVCRTGCAEDSDCGENSVCVCGPEIGECYPVNGIAGCQDDSDCEAGFLCLYNGVTPTPVGTYPFTSTSFACQLPGDDCDSDADCPSGQYGACQISGGGRECESVPVCGRPFLVADQARKAAPVISPDWLLPAVEQLLANVNVPTDAGLREALAAHWTEIGLLEHASVAAFARFTLQLLSLGAPADLVEASQRATLDEVRHAELAFALASRYAGRSIGPGPLAMTGALDACSVDQILSTTVREGCVGETRAALEASHAAETCEDPVVRSVLETIAADEARHAELAWRVVRFIVTAHPETTRTLEAEFLALHRREMNLPAAAAAAAAPSESGRFGLLDAGSLGRCHREAYRDVIAPCARTLLAMTVAA
jgi:hypothetical protein